MGTSFAILALVLRFVEIDYAPAVASNTAPSRHMRCMISASLRAVATFAFLAPTRATRPSAQLRSAEGCRTRVISAFAASQEKGSGLDS